MSNLFSYKPNINKIFKRVKQPELYLWQKFFIWFYLGGTPGVDDLPTLARLLDISMAEMSYHITATLEP